MSESWRIFCVNVAFEVQGDTRSKAVEALRASLTSLGLTDGTLNASVSRSDPLVLYTSGSLKPKETAAEEIGWAWG